MKYVSSFDWDLMDGLLQTQIEFQITIEML